MENLETALVHTVIGMGTVFIILILISLIISLFKFIPKIQAAFSKKKEEPAAATATPAAPAEPVIVEEEETDDLEIVAVITAAIAASMGTTTDGFVVRSIRRKSGNRW